MQLLIRKYRKQKGFKLIELAAAIGISKSLLSEYETGSARVPASRLWDISQILKVPVGKLFAETSEENPPHA